MSLNKFMLFVNTCSVAKFLLQSTRPTHIPFEFLRFYTNQKLSLSLKTYSCLFLIFNMCALSPMSKITLAHK